MATASVLTEERSPSGCGTAADLGEPAPHFPHCPRQRGGSVFPTMGCLVRFRDCLLDLLGAVHRASTATPWHGPLCISVLLPSAAPPACWNRRHGSALGTDPVHAHPPNAHGHDASGECFGFATATLRLLNWHGYCRRRVSHMASTDCPSGAPPCS
jgi:hypothetical protein